MHSLLHFPFLTAAATCNNCCSLAHLLQVAELCQRATEEVGEENGVRIANYLCPGNYAVSGGIPGCAAVEKLAKEYKARTVRLAVAGAFHTRYMQPAEEKLRQASARLYTAQIISAPQELGSCMLDFYAFQHDGSDKVLTILAGKPWPLQQS